MSTQYPKKILKPIIITKKTTVRELLIKNHLEKAYFVVIVDGKKAELNDIIKEGQEIIVLPKITGG